MDRDLSLGVGSFALPSRRAALDVCLGAMAGGGGPVLVTGEVGVGKTWLARRLAAETPGLSGWVGVDLSPTTRPGDLLRAIGHALGVAEPRHAGAWRLALGDALSEQSADGRPWGLIVDEVQLAPVEVLEELRVLSNRLGEADGFAAIVLVGQTPLACRFETRPLMALEARLAARVHLRPIDADEARDLLAHLRPECAADIARVERWHRDSAGNPRRLLRLASIAPATNPRPISAPSPSSSLTPSPSPLPPAREAAGPPAGAPRLGEARPPIRLEEGLIEVGWEAEAEAGVEPEVRAEVPAPAEEPVNDHYAALQAWNEWTANQGRAEAEPVEPGPFEAVPLPDDAPPLAGHPQVWVDGQQAFAPYSQLFSRMKPSKDPG